MIVHDLRTPMMMNVKVIESDDDPFEVLKTLGDRCRAMMVMHRRDLEQNNIMFGFIAYSPDTDQLVYSWHSDGKTAYELAQAQYQRDTSPTCMRIQ
ncbi:hypothetical protein [Halomonas sp.]|uniref:hypothetical protein n=1 Tax=Halomonas sp. TaxID=1486246 RepID=UPI003D0F7D51